MQPDPHARQPIRVPLELSPLLAGHQPPRRELAPVAPESACAAYPEDHLEVAQAARGFLEVRLQAVRAVLELRVPLLLLEPLRLEERLRVEAVVEAVVELREERAAPRDQPRLEKRGLDGDVLCGLVAALLDRPHAVAELEPDVPEPADELLDLCDAGRIEGMRQQAQDVDVRVRIELAAAEAPHRDERELARQAGLAPQLPQARVDELTMTPQEARCIRVGLVLAAERGTRPREALAQPRRVVRRLEASRRDRGHPRDS